MRNDDGVRMWLRFGLAAVAAIVIAVRPIAADVIDSESRDSTVKTLQISRNNQVVLTAAPSRLPSDSAVGNYLTSPSLDARGILGSDVVAYAFRIAVVDSFGARFSRSASVESVDAAVFAGERLLVQLAGTTAVSLPRPFGFFLTAGDTLRIVARITPAALADSESIRLRLIIDCEPTERPVSRLAVMIVDVSRPASELANAARSDRAIATWTWTSEIAGRAMAISGAAVEKARELSLTDVTTGEVLWRDLRQPDGPGFSETRCARIGAAVLRRDHVYQVAIRYADASQVGDEPPHRTRASMRIMVLPTQVVSIR
ncbi:MAG TPA: hypothetical protein VL383_13765 [Gemmatimonadaceae bacterium]|nr:hypothetical protein [Gemmatimonadaceae bacterium]